MKEFTHPNQLWAALLVEELVRQGSDYFCIAPGSRSAPLVTAVSSNSRAKSFLHFDERGLAFHALGYARATGKPAVVITTSGTAVANLYPAIVEASTSRIPLIILTADRPPELRDSGANQAIDQTKFFGDYVRWQFDLPCPSEGQAPEQILTLVAQAMSSAQGEIKGPVHLNCQFREPLTPVAGGKIRYSPAIEDYWQSTEPFTHLAQPSLRMLDDDLRKLAVALDSFTDGIVVLGELSPQSDPAPIRELLAHLNWPVLPDVLSGFRQSPEIESLIPNMDLVFSQEDHYPGLQPQMILHLGGKLTSKRASRFIQKSNPCFYAVIQDHSIRIDPGHQVRFRVQADISGTCSRLTELLKKRPTPNDPWITKWKAISNRVESSVTYYLSRSPDQDTPLTEPLTAREMMALAPQNSTLFVAASMPIRDVESFSMVRKTPLQIASNRGASGIDGTLASAAGFAAATGRPVTTLVGDLAFLHDLNSLAMFKSLSVPMITVVINNDGGGIFSFLPISQFPAAFDPYFSTPHGLQFEAIARQFGLAYETPRTLAELRNNYREALELGRSTLIEIKTLRDANRAEHELIIEEIRTGLNEKGNRT